MLCPDSSCFNFFKANFERLFLTVPRGCLQFVIVVFPDHTHLLFFSNTHRMINSLDSDQAQYL